MKQSRDVMAEIGKRGDAPLSSCYPDLSAGLSMCF